MIICNTWFYYFEQYLLLYFYYKYNFIRIFILKTIKNMLNYRYIQFMKFERKIEMKQDLRTALGGGGNRVLTVNSEIDKPSRGMSETSSLAPQKESGFAYGRNSVSVEQIQDKVRMGLKSNKKRALDKARF